MEDRILIRNVQGIDSIDINIHYPDSKIAVITGKNGVGKTTLVKALRLLEEPDIFRNTSSHSSISDISQVYIELNGHSPFSFQYNSNEQVMDSRDRLPIEGTLFAELPIPVGSRFKNFDRLFSRNEEIAASNASGNYEDASDLIEFLYLVYSSDKFDNLKSVKIGPDLYYFIPKEDGTYLREDHLSSGEYFLIQIFKLISSNAQLIVIDELDVSLDASAQVKLYAALRSIVDKKDIRLIIISHSLAFMSTVDDGSLYYFESDADRLSLNQCSFGYIKSDLYGFKGFDRYILTEDPVLEGFIEFLIPYFSITPFYMCKVIGVGGVNQLRSLVEKNDRDEIFTSSINVLAISDGDVFPELTKDYSGSVEMFCSPVDDLEIYLYRNRERLLPGVTRPDKESSDLKRASKTYWKYLINHKKINANVLYEKIADDNPEQTIDFAMKIENFINM